MTLARFEQGAVIATLEESALEVAQRMKARRVGCVVVTRASRPIGILTDRDLALRVVADGKDPSTTKVEDIVTYDATTIPRDAGIETAARLMRDHGIRRLPIVAEDGSVTGVVTADDLVILIARELSDLGAGLSGNVDTNESR